MDSRRGLTQEPLVLVGSWRSRGVVSPRFCQPSGAGCAKASATTASDVPGSTTATISTFVDLANWVSPPVATPRRPGDTCDYSDHKVFLFCFAITLPWRDRMFARECAS